MNHKTHIHKPYIILFNVGRATATKNIETNCNKYIITIYMYCCEHKYIIATGIVSKGELNYKSKKFGMILFFFLVCGH